MSTVQISGGAEPNAFVGDLIAALDRTTAALEAHTALHDAAAVVERDEGGLLPTVPGHTIAWRLDPGPAYEWLWAHLYPDGWRSIGGDYIDPDDLAAHDWHIVAVPVQDGAK